MSEYEIREELNYNPALNDEFKEMEEKPFYRASFSKKFTDIINQVLRITGASVLLLAAIIGFSTGVSFLGKNKKTLELQGYDNFIWPVVMQDPSSFDENTQPEQNMMIRAAIWDAAASRKEDEKNFNEDYQLIIPSIEVQTSVKKLFGKEVDLNNTQLDEAYYYKFKKDEGNFLVEPVSIDQSFVPHTVSARADGKDIILNVGYVLPQEQFNSEMNKAIENKVEKFAKYTLKDNPLSDGKFISSIK